MQKIFGKDGFWKMQRSAYARVYPVNALSRQSNPGAYLWSRFIRRSVPESGSAGANGAVQELSRCLLNLTPRKKNNFSFIFLFVRESRDHDGPDWQMYPFLTKFPGDGNKKKVILDQGDTERLSHGNTLVYEIARDECVHNTSLATT